MRSKLIVLSLILLAAGCSLLDKPVIEIEDTVAYNETESDSIIIEEPGLYEFRFYSDYPADVIFFSRREGMELFLDSGMLYSEAVFQSMVRESVDYFYEQAFIFDEIKLYFVIDNTSLISAPEAAVSYDIEIYKQEE